MFDVTIIGCGVIGAVLARKLSQYDLRILILERENDVAMGTTKANSAIVHAGYDPEPGTLMAKLNVQGSEQMEKLCRELDVEYRRCGSMVLAFSAEETATLKTLYDRGIKNGVKELRLLSGERPGHGAGSGGNGAWCAAGSDCCHCRSMGTVPCCG